MVSEFSPFTSPSTFTFILAEAEREESRTLSRDHQWFCFLFALVGSLQSAEAQHVSGAGVLGEEDAVVI